MGIFVDYRPNCCIYFMSVYSVLKYNFNFAINGVNLESILPKIKGCKLDTL